MSTYKCWLWIYICSVWACGQHRMWDCVQLPLIGSTSFAKQDLVPSTGSFTATLAFFFCLLRLPLLAALAFCSASQHSTIEAIKITKEFFPPVTLTKPGVSMQLFEKRNDHMLVIPHLHEYRYIHWAPTCRVVSLHSLQSLMWCHLIPFHTSSTVSSLLLPVVKNLAVLDVLIRPGLFPVCVCVCVLLCV